MQAQQHPKVLEHAAPVQRHSALAFWGYLAVRGTVWG